MTADRFLVTFDPWDLPDLDPGGDLNRKRLSAADLNFGRQCADERRSRLRRVHRTGRKKIGSSPSNPFTGQRHCIGLRSNRVTGSQPGIGSNARWRSGGRLSGSGWQGMGLSAPTPGEPERSGNRSRLRPAIPTIALRETPSSTAIRDVGHPLCQRFAAFCIAAWSPIPFPDRFRRGILDVAVCLRPSDHTCDRVMRRCAEAFGNAVIAQALATKRDHSFTLLRGGKRLPTQLALLPDRGGIQSMGGRPQAVARAMA